MNTEIATNSQLSTTESKKNLSKQLEQEQNHRNGDHAQGCQQGGGRGDRRVAEKVQGIRRISGRHKTDRGRLRLVWEMEKPKNLHVGPMDMN